MGYSVNLDKPDSRATVHTFDEAGSCPPQIKQPADGDWLGPFATREEAMEAAQKTGRQVHCCQRCNP